MKKTILSVAVTLFAGLAGNLSAYAHGPLFSPGPETIFKGGTQITTGFQTSKSSGVGQTSRSYQLYLEAEYGLTSDWQVGIEIPYAWKNQNGFKANGLADIVIDSKYLFWKKDLPGAQYKVAALAKLKFPIGKKNTTPRLGSGSVDVTGGLTAGYESRRWYWFTSAAYRANTKGSGGLKKGDMQFLNIVGGIRPVLTEYTEPDTVLMLEVNWQRAERDKLGGNKLANTGGWELFVSPLVWWTSGQVAIRGGVQIPLVSALKGRQASADYRAKLEFVYHF